MDATTTEILSLVREEDVKFIRLAYCDLYGIQKNMAIMASQLPRAFAQGIPFDASAAAGFSTPEHTDLFLVPDGSTVSILPWRPVHERVMRMMCDIKNPDGTDFSDYTRNLLKTAIARAAACGYIVNVSTECEFYLFKTDAAGEPTMTPHDRGGFDDIAPLDKGENIRREICLALEEMGLRPECSHHERGPGQHEVDFRYADALSAADNFITFKMAVKAIAAQNGLFASFMPKPLADCDGNGLHINLSLSQGGRNLFRRGDSHSPVAESFIAGILSRAADMTALLNPIPNSYSRLGRFDAPRYVTWSYQNRAQLIRIPPSDDDHVRMELCSADAAVNPYLAFALLIHAGLDGIENGETLAPPCCRDLTTGGDSRIERLPETLDAALDRLEKSEFIRRVVPASLLGRFLADKREECRQTARAADPHAHALARYFEAL